MLDVCLSEGEAPDIALEYVDGETLHAYIDREMRRTGRVGRGGLRWIWQLAVILSALHMNGIVHRDLKPAKVTSVEKLTFLVRKPTLIMRTNSPAPRRRSLIG